MTGHLYTYREMTPKDLQWEDNPVLGRSASALRQPRQADALDTSRLPPHSNETVNNEQRTY